jgi:hypothetical protein
MMVLSKSFSVLRSAVTPRVLPPTIDLVRVNSRLTRVRPARRDHRRRRDRRGAEYRFNLFQMPGALYVIVAVHGGGRCAVDAHPEVGRGHRGRGAHHPELPRRPDGELRPPPTRSPKRRDARQPLGRNIITSLWGNCTIKVMVGFLFLYPAFVAKSHEQERWEQLMMLGLIGARRGDRQLRRQLASARLQLGHPAQLVVRSTDRGHRGRRWPPR